MNARILVALVGLAALVVGLVFFVRSRPADPALAPHAPTEPAATPARTAPVAPATTALGTASAPERGEAARRSPSTSVAEDAAVVQEFEKLEPEVDPTGLAEGIHVIVGGDPEYEAAYGLTSSEERRERLDLLHKTIETYGHDPADEHERAMYRALKDEAHWLELHPKPNPPVDAPPPKKKPTQD